MKQTIIWILALILGAVIGVLNIEVVNAIVTFVAMVFTRLFQFVAVPTIALAVMSTLAKLGRDSQTGRIFRHTITYTMLTTFASALVGLGLYLAVSPQNLPTAMISGVETSTVETETLSYTDHLLQVIPNNIITPFAAGNVLSILIIAAAIGLALAFMPQTEGKKAFTNFVFGAQEVFHTLIRALIKVLPIGIIAFSAQLSAQMQGGIAVGAIGKYVAVILGGNLLQVFFVLPIFLLLSGKNPLRVFQAMTPAVVMAFFTKSSAATLPVTIQCAEERLGVKKEVSRFVLPICTTINMNGCAAFILVTSLFVMQHSMEITPTMMLLWLFISVFSAIGNAGVPMGCYFLTLSLVSSIPGAGAIMGIILPIFAVIDMVETAENVWSDSCVCAITDKRMA